MLIGEAPGAEEDEQGRPFVGASGKMIDLCLIKAGLHRKKVYISNVVKCRPPGNRDPEQDEVGACFAYLAEEIAQVKPKVIVCIGLWAIKTLTGEGTIARARGKLLAPKAKIRVGGAKIIATYHPAAGMHNPGKRTFFEDAIIEDLKYAKNVVNPILKTAVRTLLPEGYTSRELIDALHDIQSAHVLSCDLEWLAPNRAKAKIGWPWTPGLSQLSMSLSARLPGHERAYRTVAFSWPPPAKAFDALKHFLSKRKLIFHNAMADVIWMLAAGLDPLIGGDTMLRSYLLDEHRRAGLKGLAPLVASVESGWEQKPWHRRPSTKEGWIDLLSYNADDTENTLSLDAALATAHGRLPAERRDNITRMYESLLLPAVKPFARIALAGVPINALKLRKEIRRHNRLLIKVVNRLAKRTGLRPDNAEQMAMTPERTTRYLRDAFGLEIDSSRESALIEYVSQYPVIKDIQTVRHLRKFKSTYLEPWERLLVRQGDKRLHSIYLLGATRTGRLSAEVEEGGSLLLTPREFFMRDLVDVEAEDSEFEIHSADYSQLELRIAAWLAPEHTMRALFEAGEDLHATTAAYMVAKREEGMSLTAEKFWKRRKRWVLHISKDKALFKELRQAAKGENFGLLYGMQEKHLGQYVLDNYQVRLDAQEVHRMHVGHFELYSDLKAWHERAVADAEELGYVVTPLGRYRFDIEPTQAINTPIQATGSDLCVFALSVIDEALEGRREDAQLIGFVHDCILVRVRKSKRAEIAALIQGTMEHPPLERLKIDEIPVPLVAEVAIGPTWGQAKVLQSV